MLIHPILQGFVNYGLDDYLVKSINNSNHAKTYKMIQIDDKRGRHYTREQKVNVDDGNAVDMCSRSTNPMHETSHRYKTAPVDEIPEVNTDDVMDDLDIEEKPDHPDISPEDIEIRDYDDTISPEDVEDYLDIGERELMPGYTVENGIGPNLDDEFLSRIDSPLYFPEFHRLYTARLKGRVAGITRQVLKYIDYTHFSRRVYERTFALVKDKKEWLPAIGEEWEDNIFRGMKHLSWDDEHELHKSTLEQKKYVSDRIQEALTRPTYVYHSKPHKPDDPPMGGTKYITWDVTVVVVNLPNNEGIIKTFYPTSKEIREAIEFGYDGRMPLREFQDYMAAEKERNEI